MEIIVGTSGWQYAAWKGRLYPRDLPQRAWLEHFSQRFPAVEINNTFYMLPKEETFRSWRRRSSEGFVFAVKASRYITHVRRLRDCREPLRLLWSRCRLLGDKLGPVLFQLPPNLRSEPERLRGFLRLLPKGIRAAFEFRHPSWETDEVHGALDQAGCALVLADRPGARVPQVVTGGWSYIRFHQGRSTGPGYARDKLRRWAARMATAHSQETWAFFNNDQRGAALRDSVSLSDLLRARGVAVRGPAGDASRRRSAGRPRSRG
jgi:uncharacterized protein YecE (DUF72 family)